MNHGVISNPRINAKNAYPKVSPMEISGRTGINSICIEGGRVLHLESYSQRIIACFEA